VREREDAGAGPDAVEPGDAVAGDHDAEARGGGGEQERLGHELSDDRSARRAERPPHRQVTTTMEAPDEEEVGHVRAAHHEDQHGAEQQAQHGRGELLAHVLVVEGPQRGGDAVVGVHSTVTG